MLHPLVNDWWCCALAQVVFNRPDEEAMNRALERNQFNRGGIILRLAWKLGLRRDEIRQLRWADFSFHTKVLHLPDRTIPMDDDSCIILQACSGLFYPESAWVVASERHHRGQQMEPESISRCAKATLNKEGIVGISLADLRNDFVIRALEKHEWPYVSGVSGMSVNTLFAKFNDYLPSKRTGKRYAGGKNVYINENQLWRLMNEEGSSPVGLALQFCWLLGIDARDAVELTWDQIDFDTGLIHLTDQTEPMPATLRLLLERTKEDRGPDADPHVILTTRTMTPMDGARISRSVRTALIRAGMPDVTLRNLKEHAQKHTNLEKILQRAAGAKGITRKETAAMLEQSVSQAYNQLRELVDQQQLVVVGKKYYLAGTVVLPEEQYQIICTYLSNVGSAYRQDICDLLRISGVEAKRLLSGFVEEGKLARTGQMYSLPKESQE